MEEHTFDRGMSLKRRLYGWKKPKSRVMNFVARVVSSSRFGSRSGPSTRLRRMSQRQGTSDRFERTSLSSKRFLNVMSSILLAAARLVCVRRCR